MDWEPLAASTFYLGPMQNTAKVGADAARFIDLTVKQTGLKTKHIHFIGKKSVFVSKTSTTILWKF